MKDFKKRAEAGIGTLILFIALILVAAVASGVLIQTSSSLQSKALMTGSQAKTQVSSNALVLSVWGEDASDDQGIEQMTMKIKLAPGSDAMKLNDSYVSFSTQNTKKTYTMNQTGSTCNSSSITASPDYFIVDPQTQKQAGYLQTGDVLDICFQLPVTINESTELSVSWVPKIGTQSVVRTFTPDVMTDMRVILFP